MFKSLRSSSKKTSPEPTPVPARLTPPAVLVSPIAEIEMVGAVVVATLTVTELTGDSGAGRLADLLYELGQSGAKHFVLDIQNVQYMDSACLGCLVAALNLLSAQKGRIALANGVQAVQSLFRLTRLDRVFVLKHDVMAAIEAVEDRPDTD